jgi:hypothetical protein
MTKVALLIGVGEYGNDLSPLPAAPKDVEAMREVLENPEIGGFDQVTPLINPERQAMEEAIYTLFDNRKKDDLLLLFFSGHGVKDDSGNLYLAAHNTRKQQEALVQPTAVAASYVQNIMSNSRSKRQVVILDCCFSGAFAQGMTAKDDGSVPVKQQLGGEGRAVLTSSTSTQYSFESQGFDLSVYTHFLVEGIKTGIADKDQDGVVSIDELHEYASEKAQETAPGKMKPEIYPIREGSKILLAKVRVEDSKLKYRQDVERRLKDGKIPPIARNLLDLKRNTLQVTPEEAAVIEAEVLKPYREYEAKLQQYKQVLSEAIKAENPISNYTRNQLKDYQEFWGLKDEDVVSIEARIILERESTNSNQNALSTEESSFQVNISSKYIDTHNSVISDIQGKPTIQSSSRESLINDFNATLTTDCTQLQDLLVAGNWKEANQKTRAIMLKLSGREQEGKLQAEDCRQLSCESLSEIDQLWVKYSNGRFGFSVQQRIWQSLGGSKSAGYDTFKSFGDRVGWSLEGNWRSQDNLIFSLNAPDGHLPYCREWLNWGYSNTVVNRFSALISRLEECGIKPAILGTEPDIKLESPDVSINYPQQLNFSQLSVSQPQSNFAKVSQHKNKLYVLAAFLLFAFIARLIFLYPIYTLPQLDDQLSVNNWRDADQTTSDIIRDLSETPTGYISSTNSNKIKCEYLTKINNLWEKSSRNFGFQKQRNIWEKVKHNQSEFEKKIDWYGKKNSDLIFNETAPVGHLPSAGRIFYSTKDYTNKLEECFKAQK